jgi:hypothetical protein
MTEVWVPAEGGIIYSAPNLIHHYITEHSYRPPMAFLDALEKFDFTVPWLAQEEFERRVLALYEKR